MNKDKKVEKKKTKKKPPLTRGLVEKKETGSVAESDGVARLSDGRETRTK